jgi:hypothetical protein
MAAVTYGFNGNPDSLTLLNTGSSTIPSGKYAQVTLHCAQGGTCSIAGIIVLTSPGTSWSELGSSVLTYAHNSGGGTGEFLQTTAAGTVKTGDAFTSNTATTNTSSSSSYWVPTGTSITCTPNSGYAMAVIQLFST